MSVQSMIVLALIVAAVVYVIAIYNGLVTARNRFKNAFSQIDVQLQRRYDLIPNLVETAKAYMSHEREALEAVIQARNQAQGAARGAARRGDPFDRLLQRPLVLVDGSDGAGRHGDLRPGRGQSLGDRGTDATAGTGDDRHFAFTFLMVGVRHATSPRSSASAAPLVPI